MASCYGFFDILSFIVLFWKHLYFLPLSVFTPILLLTCAPLTVYLLNGLCACPPSLCTLLFPTEFWLLAFALIFFCWWFCIFAIWIAASLKLASIFSLLICIWIPHHVVTGYMTYKDLDRMVTVWLCWGTKTTWLKSLRYYLTFHYKHTNAPLYLWHSLNIPT